MEGRKEVGAREGLVFQRRGSPTKGASAGSTLSRRDGGGKAWTEKSRTVRRTSTYGEGLG